MSRLPLLPRGSGAAAPIERASANDLMELAADVGPMRVQIGALLRFAAAHPDPAAVHRVLAERTSRIPRLRQVLRRVPLGCGRPVWVDDTSFSVADHIQRIIVPGGDERAASRAAAALVAAPMTYARPLWRAAVLADPGGSAIGIVIVVHHVLADGIGGLAVLSRLVDGSAGEPGDPAPGLPRPLPTRLQLAADAMRGRRAGLRAVPAAVASVPAAVAGFRAGRTDEAAATSLSRPVSGALQVAAARVPLWELHDAARRAGATLNDAVLVAVAATVRAVLAERGEALGHLHVSVPVSLRSEGPGAAAAPAQGLGNRVATMLVAVPAAGPPAERLRLTATQTRERKAAARTASGPLVVMAFRAMGAVGLLRPFIERQRLVQAFVSNVPGPRERVGVAGAPVAGITPMTTLAGNVALSFLALSYAGELVVSISADPAVLPDVDRAAQVLAEELQRLVQPR